MLTLRWVGQCSNHFYSDNAFGRVLSDEIPDNANLTVEECVSTCDSANFTIAGMEFSVQCCMFLNISCIHYDNIILVCGNEIINGGVAATDANDCDMLCGGNASSVIFPCLDVSMILNHL